MGAADEQIELPKPALHLAESPRRCSYLPAETASLEYRIYPTLTAEQLQFLIERGWRRFGMQVFRPRCAACVQCIPVRVDVAAFRPSKDQRRAWRRNADVEVSLHAPTVTQEHLDLYNAWHVDMTARRSWPDQQTDFDSYAEGFLLGDFDAARELRYFRNGELIGIGLIDLLPRGISSAYFFHAPHWRPDSPGTFSALCEIELAQRLGLAHLYLGYWISKCSSMSYKNRFRPYEMLLDRPGDSESPRWQTAEPDSSEQGGTTS